MWCDQFYFAWDIKTDVIIQKCVNKASSLRPELCRRRVTPVENPPTAFFVAWIRQRTVPAAVEDIFIWRALCSMTVCYIGAFDIVLLTFCYSWLYLSCAWRRVLEFRWSGSLRTPSCCVWICCFAIVWFTAIWSRKTFSWSRPDAVELR